MHTIRAHKDSNMALATTLVAALPTAQCLIAYSMHNAVLLYVQLKLDVHVHTVSNQTKIGQWEGPGTRLMAHIDRLMHT